MSISKILIVILIIVAIAVAAVFIMGRFEATKPIYDKIMIAVSPSIEQIKSFVSTPTGAVTSIGGVGSLVTVGLAAYSKINSAKQQLTQVTDSAKSQIDSLQSKYEGVTQQLSDAEAKAKELAASAPNIKDAVAQATSLSNNEVVKLTNLNTNLNQQKIELQNQFNQLQTRYNELRNLTAPK